MGTHVKTIGAQVYRIYRGADGWMRRLEDVHDERIVELRHPPGGPVASHPLPPAAWPVLSMSFRPGRLADA